MANVELVYLPKNAPAFHIKVEFVEGMSVSSLLQETHFFEKYPDMKNAPMGIFSEKITINHILRPGDRVEIYRELMSDPKEKRRARSKRP